MYRTWVAIGLAGFLAGVAVVSLFAGFGSPVFLGVAAVSAAAGLLAYRYARERMLRSVYAGVETGSGRGTDDRTAHDAASGGAGREPPHGTEEGAGDRRRTAQATDGGETTADYADGGGTTADYDDWTWAGSDPDDPFWSDDPEDWEDPWEWEATDPADAAGSGWRGWGTDAGTSDGTDRRTGRSGGRRGSAGDRRDAADEAGDGRSATEGMADRPTVGEAYETLGLEPGADPGAVRRAYRERAKETHPDRGGDPEAFIRVREAYERLREHLDGAER